MEFISFVLGSWIAERDISAFLDKGKTASIDMMGHCSLLWAHRKFVNGGFVYSVGFFFFTQVLCFVVSSVRDNISCIGNGMCNSTTGISKSSEDKQAHVDQHDKVDSNLFNYWSLWHFPYVIQLACPTILHNTYTYSVRTFK